MSHLSSGYGLAIANHISADITPSICSTQLCYVIVMISQSWDRHKKSLLIHRRILPDMTSNKWLQHLRVAKLQKKVLKHVFCLGSGSIYGGSIYSLHYQSFLHWLEFTFCHRVLSIQNCSSTQDSALNFKILVQFRQNCLLSTSIIQRISKWILILIPVQLLSITYFIFSLFSQLCPHKYVPRSPKFFRKGYKSVLKLLFEIFQVTHTTLTA